MLKSSCQAVEWFGVNSKRLWLRIGMNHDTQNELWGGEVVLLTASEFEALEARKPQVPAEVIARTQGALIGWQNADEFDTEELQEHGDVLRDATRALLAAVEAAPAPTPDFASMSADDLSLVEVQALRDWLDERGQRSTWNSVEFDWSARLCDDSGKEIARTVDHFDETEALLALCQKVAAEEAS